MDAKIRELYQDELIWSIVAGVFSGTMLLTKSLYAAAILSGLVLLFPILKQYINLSKIKPIVEPKELITDGIRLGTAENGTPIRLPFELLNHVFIIGITRYGKTRLVMSLITELLDKYDPDELKIGFSDAKAVSFNVFARSRHLFAPIAKSPEATENLIELLLEEMYSRMNTFSEYHEKICTNLDEYYKLSGEKLPRIVVFFDEVADSIDMGSQAEKNLTTLAKMGLAAGIHVVLITQRPTKVGISHEIVSQCQTRMATFMINPTEYGSVAKIPQEIYNKMTPTKGLFMAFNPDLAPIFTRINPEYKGWGFIRSHYLENETIEDVALRDSTSNLDLPTLESSIPAWQGSEDEKLTAMAELEKKLGTITTADMKRYFGVTGRTASTWLAKFYDS